MKNKVEGKRHYRTRSNPKERIAAELWDYWNSYPYQTLNFLLDEKVDQGWLPEAASDHDHTVAATVIQWLGSPVGQQFLDELQGKWAKIKPEDY